jgi:hypothetical protein
MRGTLGSTGKAAQVQDNREIRRKKGRLDPRRRRSSKNLDYQRINPRPPSFPNNFILRQPYAEKASGKTSPSSQLSTESFMKGSGAGMSPSDGIVVKWIKHLLVWVYEAPSSEALQKFSMEPEMVKWMAWNTSEIKLAMSLEESTQLLK